MIVRFCQVAKCCSIGESVKHIGVVAAHHIEEGLDEGVRIIVVGSYTPAVEVPANIVELRVRHIVTSLVDNAPFAVQPHKGAVSVEMGGIVELGVNCNVAFLIDISAAASKIHQSQSVVETIAVNLSIKRINHHSAIGRDKIDAAVVPYITFARFYFKIFIIFASQ